MASPSRLDESATDLAPLCACFPRRQRAPPAPPSAWEISAHGVRARELASSPYGSFLLGEHSMRKSLPTTQSAQCAQSSSLAAALPPLLMHPRRYGRLPAA